MEKDCYITQILGRFRAGEDEAVQEVYNKYRKKFVSVLYKKYKDNFSIHDIVTEYQECLSIFYEYVVTRPDFTIRSSIDQYLIRMGLNRLYRKYKAMTATVSWESVTQEQQEAWISDNVPAPQATTDRTPLMYQYLDEMQEPGATMWELYLEGKSYNDIRGALASQYPGLSAGAVKARLHRSFKKFRKWVDDDPPGRQGA